MAHRYLLVVCYCKELCGRYSPASEFARDAACASAISRRFATASSAEAMCCVLGAQTVQSSCVIIRSGFCCAIAALSTPYSPLPVVSDELTNWSIFA